MNDSIEIKKNKMEYYVIEWDSHKNYVYVAIKVVQQLKHGKKYKNMITLPAIDQTLPDALQKRQLKEAVRVADEIAKAVKMVLNNMPKKKVEF